MLDASAGCISFPFKIGTGPSCRCAQAAAQTHQCPFDALQLTTVPTVPGGTAHEGAAAATALGVCLSGFSLQGARWEGQGHSAAGVATSRPMEM